MSHGVPVLMYHSVGRVLEDWHWAILTVPWWTFEDHLRALRRGGYTTVGFPELFEYVAARRALPERTVVLTLDDGYLDNWTHAVPLLRRYGFSATVLVTPEFVDPREVRRPTLDDVWAGRAREPDLEVRGFMSWTELAAAAAEGVLFVQSHALTHTWYPTDDTVVDFHHPGDAHYWLDWNAAPPTKPYYLQFPAQSRVAWGTPVYRHAKSLETTAYRPDPREADYVTAHVSENGGARFFSRPDWRATLDRVLSGFRAERGVRGEPETPAERCTRFERELVESKRTIESRLGSPVRHLVWPGGGYCDESLDIALGEYDSVSWSGDNRWTLRNRPSEDPRLVARRGVPFVEDGSCRVYTGGNYLIRMLEEYAGKSGARRSRQAMKAAVTLGLRLGMWPLDRRGRIPLRPRKAGDA